MGKTNSAEKLNYLVFPSVFQFKRFEDPNCLSFIRFQYILHDSGVLFSEFSNFQKLRRGDIISWGKLILQNRWIISSAGLYFNFKSFKDPYYLSFIRFQCVLHDSGVHFWDFLHFCKLQREDQISWGEPILQNRRGIWSPLRYFNFKGFKDSKLLSFIRFQQFLHDWGVLLSNFSNFQKSKRGDLISWVETILQNGWIILSAILYFNFKSSKDLNSSSFIMRSTFLRLFKFPEI